MERKNVTRLVRRHAGGYWVCIMGYGHQGMRKNRRPWNGNWDLHSGICICGVFGNIIGSVGAGPPSLELRQGPIMLYWVDKVPSSLSESHIYICLR